MEPEMVREDPTLIELEFRTKETAVGDRVKVVKAVDVLPLVTV
jgi:hypothetical protein